MSLCDVLSAAVRAELINIVVVLRTQREPTAQRLGRQITHA